MIFTYECTILGYSTVVLNLNISDGTLNNIELFNLHSLKLNIMPYKVFYDPLIIYFNNHKSVACPKLSYGAVYQFIGTYLDINDTQITCIFNNTNFKHFNY